MKKRMIAFCILFLNALAVAMLVASTKVMASSIPKYHDIPAYQQKDVYSNDRVTIQGISVDEIVNDTVSPMVTKPVDAQVQFILFNTTKQEVEGRVSSKDGTLEPMQLVKGHNYMIVAEDKTYRMNTVYVMVQGNQLVDIKNYPKADDGKPLNGEYSYPTVEQFYLYQRVQTLEEYDYNRYTARIPVVYGEGPMSNVKFKLVSDFETKEAVCKNGMLTVELLEDIAYMVTIENDQYEVESFPLVVKDKSEYDAGRFTYDHSSCHVVGVFAGDNVPIRLLDKGEAHKNDTTITSISGSTTISGLNFKDIIALEKKLDKSVVKGLEGKLYDVIDIKTVNPHRWEVSKLCSGDFSVTENVGNNKVANVYVMEKDGQLQKIDFQQTNNKVSFELHSLSVNPIVIEYTGGKAYNDAPKIVYPKATSISKLKAGKKRITVTLKKQLSGTRGYQIQYSTKKNFKGAKTKLISKNTTVKTTIKKLKSKKKYYVRVRTYNTYKENGKNKTIYSKWSSAKKIKVK